MKRFCTGCSCALAVAAATPAGAALIGYGLNMQNELVSFDVTAPGTLLSARFIQGMQPNEQMLTIDFRPADGQLYGLGSHGWLYRLDRTTGQATNVAASPVGALNGTEFDLDFNPVTDRISVVSDLGQNLTLSANGQPISSGPTIIGARILGAGYSNNFNGAATTTLYGLGTSVGSVLRVFSINTASGAVTALPFNLLPSGDVAGVDVFGATTGFLLDTSLGGTNRLYEVDLANPATLTLRGDFQGGSLLRDIAVPAPGGVAVLAAGLLAFRRRR